jgi:predicted oxidoreductase
MQMHWPVALKKGAEGTAPEDFAPLDTKATWQAMEKCVESGGKTKAIGISNFSVEKTEKLLSYAKVVPAVNQVECHPVWQQKKLQPYLRSKGIHLSVSLSSICWQNISMKIWTWVQVSDSSGCSHSSLMIIISNTQDPKNQALKLSDSKLQSWCEIVGIVGLFANGIRR